MSQTIGQQLKEARQEKGLSLDDVFHQTRIPTSGLEGMESDDFSVFPNATYRKSFLTLYSEFLGVDASEMVQAMSRKPSGRKQKPDFLETDLHLNPTETTIPIVKHRIIERKPQRSAHGLVLFLMLVVLIPSVYYVGKWVGFQEMVDKQGGNLSETASEETSLPQEQEAVIRAKVITPSPLDQYSDRPVRVYQPDPEMNALIGIGDARSGGANR